MTFKELKFKGYYACEKNRHKLYSGFKLKEADWIKTF